MTDPYHRARAERDAARRAQREQEEEERRQSPGPLSRKIQQMRDAKAFNSQLADALRNIGSSPLLLGALATAVTIGAVGASIAAVAVATNHEQRIDQTETDRETLQSIVERMPGGTGLLLEDEGFDIQALADRVTQIDDRVAALDRIVTESPVALREQIRQLRAEIDEIPDPVTTIVNVPGVPAPSPAPSPTTPPFDPSGLEARLTAAETGLTTVTGELATVRTELEAAKTAVQQAQSDLAAAQAELARLSLDVAANTAAIATAQADADAAQAAADAATATADAAQADADSALEDVTTLETEVTDISTDLVDLETQVFEQIESAFAAGTQPVAVTVVNPGSCGGSVGRPRAGFAVSSTAIGQTIGCADLVPVKPPLPPKCVFTSNVSVWWVFGEIIVVAEDTATPASFGSYAIAGGEGFVSLVGGNKSSSDFPDDYLAFASSAGTWAEAAISVELSVNKASGTGRISAGADPISARAEATVVCTP